jgi:4-hydroxy-tetrahydrodipicolinate synthase
MTFAAQREALADVVAIPVTPYSADGSVDLDTYEALLQRLVRHGVRTLTPNGNTGEFYALSPAERRALIAASARAAGDADLLVGVGHDIAEAAADLAVAAEHGVRMAMIHQPLHPHQSAEGWIEYHRAIAATQPDLAFVLYVRSEWITGEMLRRLGDIAPNIVGVKYAIPDPTVFAAVRDAAGPERFVWIAGLAEPYALSYAVHGADGFTSGLVNVDPGISLGLRDELRAGDYAAADVILRRIARFEELRADARSANNVSVVKEAMAQLGLCDRQVRPPSRPVGDSVRAEISVILDQWRADAAVGSATASAAASATASAAVGA